MSIWLILLAIHLFAMLVLHLLDWDFYRKGHEIHHQDVMWEGFKSTLSVSWIPIMNIYMIWSSIELHKNVEELIKNS